jgi:heptosyltransferase-1
MARRKAVYGFHRSLLREWPASLFYSYTVNTSEPHVVGRNMALAIAAGAHPGPAEFPLPEGRREGELPERFVLAAPLAGWTSKQWPLENYAPLARRLKEEFGLSLVLNGAPNAEAILRSVEGARVHVSGIAGLIDATRRATAVVGLDSGPMHLAAALGKPGVALFGPTDPARNGPYGGSLTVLRHTSAKTTYQRGTVIDPALRALTPEVVAAALFHSLRHSARVRQEATCRHGAQGGASGELLR